MSAPPKPWEGVGINARSVSLSFDSPSRLPIGAGGPKPNALRNPSEMDASNNSGSKPPPLPPRPQAQRSTGGYMYGGPGYGNLGLFPALSIMKKLYVMFIIIITTWNLCAFAYSLCYVVNRCNTKVWHKNENPGLCSLTTPRNVIYQNFSMQKIHPKMSDKINSSTSSLQLANQKKDFVPPCHYNLYQTIPPLSETNIRVLRLNWLYFRYWWECVWWIQWHVWRWNWRQVKLENITMTTKCSNCNLFNK